MYKYHQVGNKTVQIDRYGNWHGYVGCIYRVSFDSELEAINWLEDKAA